MELSYNNATLTHLIVHEIGSKLNDRKNVLSESEIENVPDEMSVLLTSYFLSPFKQPELYVFWHEADLKLNAVYAYADAIFNNKKSFVKNSRNVANHLYEQSSHPNIKQGELYITFFENCVIDAETVDLITIFKSETKDFFLQTHKSEHSFQIKLQEGLNTRKVDKGCMIISNRRDADYKVCVIDSTNKSNEAQYWKDDFLKIKPMSDNYHFTKNFLSVTKDFITKQMGEGVSKTDQINLLNKSVSYFNENDTFKVKEFEKEIFEDDDVIKSFRNFGSMYIEDNDIHIADTFEISTQAVKKQARAFKSVLKLDKNFHIYIHGPNELIEQGVEKDGRKFYKIYFNEEK